MTFSFEILGRMPSLNEWLSGTHWRKKHADKKRWQEEILWALKAARVRKPLKAPIRVSTTQMTKMPRDIDNTVLSLKYVLDALKVGGYLIDDNAKNVPEARIAWKKAEKHEKILLEITEV